jgi:hypothetical protein
MTRTIQKTRLFSVEFKNHPPPRHAVYGVPADPGNAVKALRKTRAPRNDYRT